MLPICLYFILIYSQNTINLKGKAMEQAELEYIEYQKDAPFKCVIAALEQSSPHWHYDYEAIFVLRGAIQVTIEGETQRLEQGGLILINSREIHATVHTENENLHLVLQWSPAMFLEIYSAHLSFKLNSNVPPSGFSETLDALRRELSGLGLCLYEKSEGYQFAAKSHFYSFINLLITRTPYTIDGAARDSVYERLAEFDVIKRYIQGHFKEDLTIDRLCRQVAMSRATVFRVLKAAGSASVNEMLHYYRIEYAKNLLRNSAFSIPYIACESGFESGSSFYRVFKQMTGLSPLQYRSTPDKKAIPTGVQDYVGYSMPQAVKLLRVYC
jgi:AraC-like DNA-binding protein/mannose-6-phosphate isomerase-like protein (cupin superfamily)